MTIERGTIVGLEGSWGSGIAHLVLEYEGETVRVPCDNGPTVRALDSAFPGFITPGHSADNGVIAGQEIYYTYDDMGLMLAGFTPVEEADEAIEAAWAKAHQEEESYGETEE